MYTNRTTHTRPPHTQIYVIVFASRLASILRHEGYLPYDKSGDWFYHVVETLSLIFAATAIYLLKFKFGSTYDESKDAFGNLRVPSYAGIVYIVVPCFLVALVFHPSLNKDYFSDISWTFSMYLESLALFPQLYMFQKQANSPIEVLVSHSVFVLGFARVVEMAFWMWSFHELADRSGGKLVGYAVLISQFIQVFLMGDFFYFFVSWVSLVCVGGGACFGISIVHCARCLTVVHALRAASWPA